MRTKQEIANTNANPTTSPPETAIKTISKAEIVKKDATIQWIDYINAGQKNLDTNFLAQLLSKGCDPNTRIDYDQDSYTGLGVAIYREDLNAIRFFASLPNIDIYNEMGGEPNVRFLIGHNCDKDKTEILKLLINGGAKLTQDDFLYAVSKYKNNRRKLDVKLFTTIIDNIKDLNKTNAMIKALSFYESPDDRSRINDILPIVQVLIEKGADVNDPVLINLIKKQNNDILSDFFVKKGTRLNPDTYQVLLRKAIEGNNFGAVQQFVEKGARVLAKDVAFAVDTRKDRKIVDFLIERLPDDTEAMVPVPSSFRSENVFETLKTMQLLGQGNPQSEWIIVDIENMPKGYLNTSNAMHNRKNFPKEAQQIASEVEDKILKKLLEKRIKPDMAGPVAQAGGTSAGFIAFATMAKESDENTESQNLEIQRQKEIANAMMHVLSSGYIPFLSMDGRFMSLGIGVSQNAEAIDRTPNEENITPVKTANTVKTAKKLSIMERLMRF